MVIFRRAEYLGTVWAILRTDRERMKWLKVWFWDWPQIPFPVYTLDGESSLRAGHEIISSAAVAGYITILMSMELVRPYWRRESYRC
jgi:hypothetical protein